MGSCLGAEDQNAVVERHQKKELKSISQNDIFLAKVIIGLED